MFFLNVHNPRTKAMDGLKAIDWLGSLSIIGLVLMLLLGLDFGGETFPWNSPTVICLIVFGALMSVVFIFCEKRLAKYPVMPLTLFQKKSNVASLLIAVFQGMVSFAHRPSHLFGTDSRLQVFIAGEYYLPLYFQSVLEASPLRSGLLILPITLSEAATSIICGLLIHRTGRYLELTWLGLVLMTIGNGLYVHLDATSSIGEIIGFQLVAGSGAGLLFQPPLIALQAVVSQDDTATTTATLGFMRNLATSLSIVIGGVIFQNGIQKRVPYMQVAGLPANITQAFSGADAAANVLLIGRIQDEGQKMVIKEAYAWALRNIWILTTCLSACGLIACFFVKKSHLSRDHIETKTGLKEKEIVVQDEHR